MIEFCPIKLENWLESQKNLQLADKILLKCDFSSSSLLSYGC